MASFPIAYDGFIQPHEAYYVNNPNDPGARTYGGIAQAIFPDWEGWPWLMNWIARNGEPKWNQQFPELDPLVRKFFNNLWMKNKFDQIQNQEVANLFFDFFVNTISVYAKTGRSVPVKEVQKIVGVSSDGVMGPQTVAAINGMNAQAVYDALLNARQGFYNRLVESNPNLGVFLEGWMDRLGKFPKMVSDNPGASAIAIGGIAGLFFLAYLYFKDE